MSLQVACLLGIGFWVVIAFIGISAVMVAAKSDEKLGYRIPIDEIVPEEDGFDKVPSTPRQRFHEPGISEHFNI